MSAEVDLYPRTYPDRADEIDGALGDGSRFHETYGYYGHGVGSETAIPPAGWEQRLVKLELPAIRRKDETVIAWCLSLPDLIFAKLAAGRPHDLEFAREAIREQLVDPDQLELGVDLMPESHREFTRGNLAIVLARSQRSEAPSGPK